MPRSPAGKASTASTASPTPTTNTSSPQRSSPVPAPSSPSTPKTSPPRSSPASTPTFTTPAEGSTAPILATTPIQRRAGHRELDRPEQPMPAGIGHRQRDTVLPDIHGNHHGRRRHRRSNRHDPPPRGHAEEPKNGAPHGTKEPDRSFIHPRSILVKDQSRSYQLSRSLN